MNSSLLIKRVALIAIIVIAIASNAFCDLGIPDIQAICRVTLKNGKIFEGAFLVATGGYLEHNDTKGFYVVVTEKNNEKIGKYLLFNLDFVAIEPFNYILEGIKSSTNDNYGFLAQCNMDSVINVYFLNDVTQQFYYCPQTEVKIDTIDTIPGKSYIKRDIIHHTVYEYLDSIQIFLSIPKNISLRYNVSEKPTMICVSDIKRFELIRVPSEKWLSQIDSVFRKIKNNISEDGDRGGVWPLWFHEIIKNDEYRNRFKPLKY